LIKSGNSRLSQNQFSFQTKIMKIMKKLKLLGLGIALSSGLIIGTSFLTSSQVEAQGEIAKCEWDGKSCHKPKDKAPCGCEDGGGGVASAIK
jgi:hypothetical protein